MVEILFLRREAEQFLQEALQSGDEARILVCEELLDDLQCEENAIRMSGEEDVWREAQRKQRQEDRVYFELEAVAEEKRQARLRFLDEEAVRLYNEYQRLGKELETMLALENWLAEKMEREPDPAYVKSLFSPRIDQAWRDYKRAMLERGVLRGALTPVSGPRTASPDDLGALRDIKVDTLLTSKIFGAGRGRFRAICPFHTEKTGSFFIFPDNSWHCFAGGTKVITSHGVKNIEELVGVKSQILNGNGKWENVSFVSCGNQRLWKLILSRDGYKKEILTTKEHRWKVSQIDTWKTTDELIPGKRWLESVRMSGCGDITLDPEGVRHGFIFGDGSTQGKWAQVRFYSKQKEDMIRFFEGSSRVLQPSLKMKYPRCCVKIKRDYKKLPTLDDSREYIAGFLAGYLAADGHVSFDNYQVVSVSCKDRQVLVDIKTLAHSLGIMSYQIRCQVRPAGRRGGFDVSKETFLSQLSFVPSTMDKCLFIRSDQSKEFSKFKKIYERIGWRIDGVEEMDKTEEVYCCETSTGSFVLEDYVLTGNCFGCQAHGHGAIDFIMRRDNCGFPEAIKTLKECYA